jgi:stage V sporulation protein K
MSDFGVEMRWTFLDQPIKNQNGKINIVLNGQKKPLRVTHVQTIEEPFTPTNHAILQEIEREMGELVGLQEMKKVVKEIYAWIYVNKKREEVGLKTERQVLHMMFKGNPGTGKTTVARLIGKLFCDMNVLSKGHLIEAERADLVGEYIGHTAQKTRDLVKKALGGILFVDEAYSLARGGEKDFGKEAIDTLVKHMEDKQHDFILILAGYQREMEEFLRTNPGLISRFPIIVDFPDYSVEELMEICQRMLKEREYIMSKEAEWKMREHLNQMKSVLLPSAFSNGRYIRNVLEKSIRTQAMRLLLYDSFHKNELMTIEAKDLLLK